ncbi:MAG: 4-(cytidine 5'-diphospho)-2-C-methyl-D-erythritol kinase [Janthinobacterium lividum]
MSTVVRSFCKINLGLAVGPPRPDGFHGLATAYQTLALHDLVTVAAKPAAQTLITLVADHPHVPSTAAGNAERNTAFRMVAAALNRLGIHAEVHLKLEKRLPVQGGLGAGSANAAAALLGLERELGVALSGTERLQLAAEVGSDVPLFLLGGTVLGLNRGEAVFPLPDSPALPIVVAIPHVGVSTAQAFRELDRRPTSDLGRVDLTHGAPADRLEELSRVLASMWTHTGAERVPTGIVSSNSSRPSGGKSFVSESLHGTEGNLAGNPLLALVRTGVENDFEAVAFRQHPSLRDIKRALAEFPDGGSAGAAYAALSGSGSALFGVYTDLRSAREAQRRVQALGARALLTETLDRQGYWQRMFA